jgi:hypothetical protein
MGDAWHSHVRGDIGYSMVSVYRVKFRGFLLSFIAYFVIACTS